MLHCGLVANLKHCQTDWLSIQENKNGQIGGISKELTEDLACAMLKKTGADYVLVVCGHGFSKEVSNEETAGTVLISIGDSTQVKTRKLHIRQEKAMFDKYVSFAGLDLLRRYFLELPMDTFYYFDDLSRIKMEGSPT